LGVGPHSFWNGRKSRGRGAGGGRGGGSGAIEGGRFGSELGTRPMENGILYPVVQGTPLGTQCYSPVDSTFLEQVAQAALGLRTYSALEWQKGEDSMWDRWFGWEWYCVPRVIRPWVPRVFAGTGCTCAFWVIVLETLLPPSLDGGKSGPVSRVQQQSRSFHNTEEPETENRSFHDIETK
jgi:hypothetical protein